MINRRNFLRASAAIALGSVIGGKTIAQAIEENRRLEEAALADFMKFKEWYAKSEERKRNEAAVADYVKFQRTIRMAVLPGAIVVRQVTA